MFQRFDKEDFEFFVGIARQIWFRCNVVVHREFNAHSIIVRRTLEVT